MIRIYAVAINTLRQALRLKIAIVFTLMLLVLLPVMGLVMTGDGTLKGRLQAFVSYGLSLTSFLLCILTIVVSVYSLTSDLEQRQAFTVLTKPVKRFELILGKFLGVILLDIILLVLFSSLIYVITIYMPRFIDVPEEQKSAAQSQFYTARASLKPGEFDLSKEIQLEYDKRLKQGQIPAQAESNPALKKKILNSIKHQKDLAKRSAAPGDELKWDFYNVKPFEPNEILFIKFKYDVSVNPPDLTVIGKWFAGDIRQYGSALKTPIFPFARKDLIRTFYEQKVPASVIAADGYLAIGFYNDPQLNATTVIFPPKDGLEVLYKADSFTSNFIRAVVLIFFRLIFLASLGLFAATSLSFPVAILLCFVVFFTGTISGFILDSISFIGENIGAIYTYTVKPIIYLLPQFDKINPSKYLVPAKLLPWSLVIRTAAIMICIKSFLLILGALAIFTHKEIAKITI